MDHLDTRVVWAGEAESLAHGGTQVPVQHSIAFGYDDVDSWLDVALGNAPGHIYSRNTNPTVRAVLPNSVMVDADGDPATAPAPLDPEATYRVTANNFLADGGDNFTLLAQGTNRFVGGLDIDALANYLSADANDPYVIQPTDRITSQP